MSTPLAFRKDLEAGASAHGIECMLRRAFELGPEEGVEDGVQATVEEGEGLCDRDPLVHDALELTALLDDPQKDEGVDADPHVIRQPAGKESQDEDDRRLESLPLLVALGVGQLRDDDAVTGEDDDARQDETHHDVLEMEHHHPQAIGVKAVTDVPVVPLADVPLADIGKDEVRYSQEECWDPDTHVDCLFSQQLPRPLTVGGMDNGEVPVQADEGQDEDTAVEVDSVDDMNSLT